jgi:hypothetical protein
MRRIAIFAYEIVSATFQAESVIIGPSYSRGFHALSNSLLRKTGAREGERIGMGKG